MPIPQCPYPRKGSELQLPLSVWQVLNQWPCYAHLHAHRRYWSFLVLVESRKRMIVLLSTPFLSFLHIDSSVQIFFQGQAAPQLSIVLTGIFWPGVRRLVMSVRK